MAQACRPEADSVVSPKSWSPNCAAAESGAGGEDPALLPEPSLPPPQPANPPAAITVYSSASAENPAFMYAIDARPDVSLNANHSH